MYLAIIGLLCEQTERHGKSNFARLQFFLSIESVKCVSCCEMQVSVMPTFSTRHPNLVSLCVDVLLLSPSFHIRFRTFDMLCCVELVER